MEETTEYIPTENQKKVLRAAKACNYETSGPKLCKACELARQSWYDWVELDGFTDWWTEQGTAWAQSRLVEVRNAVVNAGLEKVTRQGAKYNPAALKLSLDLIDGDFRRNAAEAAANTNVGGVQAFLEAITSRKDAADAPESDDRQEKGPEGGE